MDIARPEEKRRRQIRRMIYGGVGLLVIVLAMTALTRLKPAAPSVDRSTVWTDTVKRGSMLREVRGLGILVPVDIRWIPAQSSARVDKIVLQSGAVVKPDSVILELSDPQLQHDALDAEYGYKAAEADLANLKVQLANSLMAQKSSGADVESQYQQAKLQAELDKQLSDLGMQAAVISKKSTVAAEELEKKKISYSNSSRSQVTQRRRRLQQRKHICSNRLSCTN